METFRVALFGHRYVDSLSSMGELLEREIYKLIKEKEFVEFMVGINGEFDYYATSIIKSIKNKYRDDNSELTLILPYYSSKVANIIESYEEYYDNIEVCEKSVKAHPKKAICIRNCEMVDRANLIICCVEHDYGGAYTAIEYAKKQNKRIINLAE